MSKINLHIRKNKKHETFWSKVYCPLTKSSISITLGKKTDTFTSVEALKLFKREYIKV